MERDRALVPEWRAERGLRPVKWLEIQLSRVIMARRSPGHSELLPLYSMTGFAQVRGQVNGLGFTLSLKSVNHRFLDLHFRTPADTDALEVKLRRALKEKVGRGHIELTLTVDRSAGEAFAVNRALVGGYIDAFRRMAKEFEVKGEPDLNTLLRLPGAMDSSSLPGAGDLEPAVLASLADAVARLNDMRAEEGRGMERELRERMSRLQAATAEVEKLRAFMVKAHMERLNARLRELLAGQAEPERVLQEAALLAERSDVHEEIVRLSTHVQHFLGLLDSAGSEVGKKLDFLLQEMNREANTLLSKTTGLAGEALRITEMGLAMKAEIEKAREQVQNIE
jgi:uncharacterized protein (TIGR00255 family)